MKIAATLYIALILCLISASCERDHCEKSSFSVLLNERNWEGYLKTCELEATNVKDEGHFNLSIYEKNPKHDKYKDVLNFIGIPIEKGQYFMDSIDIFTDTYAVFSVFEHEYGTPTEDYVILPSGGSFITVEDIDLVENSFVISFHLVLTVSGASGELHNSSYPKVITFSEGHASGQFQD
jgi:hypothetical protein